MPGEIFRQPDLARTLRGMVEAEKKALAAGASRVAAIDAVRDYFYRGEIAKKIDEFSRANNGLLRYEDMAAFQLTPEEPVSTEFHGARVYKPGFWSQGPTMIEALNMLSGIDLTAMQREFGAVHPHADGSAEAGLCRSRHLLRRPEVRENAQRRAALDEVCGRAPEADRPDGVAGISAREDRRISRGFIPRNREIVRTQDRRLPDGARHHLRGRDR